MKSPFTFIHTAPKDLTKKQPALFLLHGMGSHEGDLPQLVKEMEETHHIFSLRGPIEFKPGYAFFTNEEEGKPIQQVFDEVLKYVQAFIREAIEKFHLDEKKIDLVGFSQGAVLAQSLAIVMGDEIRSVAALSGYIPQFVGEEYKKCPVTHLKIFISHGSYDYVIPPHWGEESKAYFESLGADVTFKMYGEGHGVTPDNKQDLVSFLKELS